MSSGRYGRVVLAALGIFWLLGGASADGASLEPVTLQLRWDHQFQFAGYYLAKARGYYRDAGFDVTIRGAITEDQQIISACDEVAQGRATFGVGAADILLARDRGADLRICATILQRSAARFYGYPSRAALRPKDLLNLRVARKVNDLIDVELQALLRSEGIDIEDVPSVEMSPTVWPPRSSTADVVPGYCLSLCNTATEGGLRYAVLDPADYGIDFYGDSLFVAGDYADAHPERVHRFTQAGLRGWSEALADPEAVIPIIIDRYERQTALDDPVAFNRYQAKVLRDLALYPVVAPGHMSPQRWRRMHEHMHAIGLIGGAPEGELGYLFDYDRLRAESERAYQRMLYFSLIAVGGLALLVITFALLLRHQVRNRTQRINTLRQEAEEAREEWRTLSENLPDCVLRCDLQHRWTYANPAALQRAHRTTAEIGGALTDFGFAPTVAQQLTEAMQDAGASGSTARLRVHCYEGGDAGEFDVQVSPEKNESGTVVSYLCVFRDVTEPLRIKDELRQSQQRLSDLTARQRLLLDALPQLVYIATSDLTYGYVNRAYCEFFDLPKEAIEGRRVPDMVGAAAWEQQQGSVRRVLSGESVEYDAVMEYPGKGPVHMMGHLVPERDSGGAVTGYFAVLTDVSRLLAMQDALRRTEAKFRQLAETTEAVLWEYDVVADRWTYVAPQSERILGWAPEEWTDFAFWSEHLHPDDRGWATGFCMECTQKGQAHEFEYRFLKKDGSTIWIRDVVSVQMEEGKPVMLRGLMIDISDRREAEEALREREETYRALVSGLPDIVMRFDREGRHLFVSENVIKFSGMAACDFIGKTHRELGFPEDLCKIWEGHIAAAFDTGKPQETQFELKLPSGPLVVDWRLLPEFTSSGEVHSVLTISRDITESQRLQERVRQVDRLQAIGQLAGGVAHDFNNQLTAIVAFAEVLSGRLSDPPLKALADQIFHAADNAAELTAQLLAFARKGKVLSKAVDTDEVMRGVAAILHRTIDKRIAVRLDLKARNRFVQGDPAQLENAVLNLALNAKDAMPDGGRLLLKSDDALLDADTIALRNLDCAPGRYVRLQVSDTGVGMDESVRGHIFEPFFTTKEQGQGTGMGLAAVYGTVKSHTGAITVESNVGQGTTFDVYLPAGSAAPAPATPTSRARRTHHARLLVVEDEELVRKAVSHILTSAGYTVVTARDGGEALEVYRNDWRSIDVVILDMIMPIMSGHDTFVRMKQINPRIRALLVSGYSLSGKAERTLAAGVKAFVQKPFTAWELVEKVEQVLTEETIEVE